MHINTLNEAARAAMERYRAGLDEYITTTGRDESGFKQTDEGHRLDREATVISQIASGPYVDIGGTVLTRHDMRAEVEREIARALYEHGCDRERWPRDVAARIYRDAQVRRRSHGEVLRDRKGALGAAAAAAIERVRSTHGPDPRAWPDADLDRIAQVQQRAHALELVADSCTTHDAGWQDAFVTDATNTKPKRS